MGMKSTDSEIIDRLGGTTVLADLFGIKPPSVSEWREKGIPSARKQTLALLFPNKTPRNWLPSTNNDSRHAVSR